MKKLKNDLTKIECRGYGWEFVIALLMFFAVFILSFGLFLESFIYIGTVSSSLLLLCTFFLFILCLAIVINVFLIVINKSFLIENKKIIYTDWLGKQYLYTVNEIKTAKWIHSLKDDRIKIIMKDGKKIVITQNWMTNFSLLREKFDKEHIFN